MATAYMDETLKSKVLDTGEAEVHRIRITLTSLNVANLEKVCAILKKRAMEHTNNLKVKGPVHLPTKVLKHTTRKTPCGEGTNTWDRYQMRIHKRLIDLQAPADAVKHITTVTIEPDVEVEITIASRKLSLRRTHAQGH